MTIARYSFDAVVHARPALVRSGPSYPVRGLDLPTLDLSPAEFESFPRTFEEVGSLLERWERMYFEPDGSFVWVSSVGDAPWQLDGVLYDRDGQVLHMELKGTCPVAEFDRITATLGRPTAEMVFQLTREALYFDDATFRLYAAAGE